MTNLCAERYPHSVWGSGQSSRMSLVYLGNLGSYREKKTFLNPLETPLKYWNSDKTPRVTNKKSMEKHTRFSRASNGTNNCANTLGRTSQGGPDDIGIRMCSLCRKAINVINLDLQLHTAVHIVARVHRLYIQCYTAVHARNSRRVCI